MTYAELLDSDEWKVKRIKILERDKYSCQHCFNNNIISNSRKGIIDYILGGYIGSILIIEFGKADNSVLNISKKEFSLLKTKMIFLFEEHSGWCRVLGIRSMSKKEIDTYINQRNSMLENSLIAQMFNISPIPEELENILSKPLMEITGDKKPEWKILKGLHVHHKYYKVGCLPWQYPNDALITLCWSCHEELHKNTKVAILNEAGYQEGLLTPCSRCFGAGWFPEHNHVQSGLCFRCRGAKYEEFIY